MAVIARLGSPFGGFVKGSVWAEMSEASQSATNDKERRQHLFPATVDSLSRIFAKFAMIDAARRLTQNPRPKAF